MAEPPIKVLVVDDNPDNRAVLVRRLQRRGYLTAQAQSGKEALRLLASEPADVVLLDVMMPEMDGIEVLRRIRSDPRTAQLPVIIATAKNESTDMVSALEQGADDYVVKPIDFEVLQARLRAVLRRRQGVSAPGASAPPQAPRKVEPGTVLDGKYKLEVLIGSGGFGSVYKGLHLTLANPVAVKVLHPHVAESRELRQRFQQEGMSLCRLRHPNAVTVFDAGTSHGVIPYLVMEYLEGLTLESFLSHYGPVPLSRAAQIISPVIDVLHHAHQSGLVHRDIKPANIYLSQTPRGEVVKVLDFGIARLLHRQDERELSSSQAVLGTPQFMAPERLTGEPWDHRVDVYAVAATLYLMLAGTLPHGATEKNIIQQMHKQLTTPMRPIEDLVPALPLPLAAMIMRALARKADERPELPVLLRSLSEYAETGSSEPLPVSVAAGLSLLQFGDTMQGTPADGAVPAPGADTAPLELPQALRRQKNEP
ncbi:MAG: response regulator [Polyangia bacterium]